MLFFEGERIDFGANKPKLRQFEIKAFFDKMRPFCTISGSTFWKIHPYIYIYIYIYIYVYMLIEISRTLIGRDNISSSTLVISVSVLFHSNFKAVSVRIYTPYKIGLANFNLCHFRY